MAKIMPSRDSLEELLSSAQEFLSMSAKNSNIGSDLLRSAMLSLRRMIEAMLYWITISEGLWENVSCDEHGNPTKKDPTIADCLKVLKAHRKLSKHQLRTFDKIRSLGNKAVHEEKECLNYNIVKSCIEDMRSYLPIYFEKYSQTNISSGTTPKKRTSNHNSEILGCDIGNGYGYVSVLKNIIRDPLPLFPLKYNLDKIGMPASAYIEPPSGKNIEVFTNRPAKDAHRRTPQLIVDSIKTKLRNPTINVPGIDAPVSAYAVYAAIARDLVKLANKQRAIQGQKPIYDLVYAFPAEFDKDITMLNRMQKSIESVVLDGHHLHVAGRLPEPAAVAIDYLYCTEYSDSIKNDVFSNDSFTTIVYDLGHGTFDTAVVTASKDGDPYKLHLFEGIEIGGQDFDELLYQDILRTLEEKFSYIPKNSLDCSRIRQDTIEAKINLSSSTEAVVAVNLEDGDFAEITITRDYFEELTRPLLDETIKCIKHAAEEAKNRGINIDAVILSGGASQMPMVRSRLQETFGSNGIPVIIHRPETAVSFGTARYACCISHQDEIAPVINQTVNHSCGISLPNPENMLESIVPVLLTAGAELPATSKKIDLLNSSGRIVIRLCQSKDASNSNDILPIERCEEIIRIPFNVPANEKFSISLTMNKDYNISVTCETQDGSSKTKSTNDSLDKLID